MTKYYLGIELAGEQLKVAAFIKEGKVYKLYRLERLDIGSDLEKSRELLVSWIKNTFPQGSQVEAVLSVPESSLYLREVSLPKLSGRKLAEALYWEVASFVPFPKDDLILDWKELERNDKGVKVLAVCARESSIRKLTAFFDNLGINILCVEPSSVSFIRTADADFERTTLLITVEHKETNLLILKRSVPVFATSISTPIIPEDNAKRKLSKTVIEDLASQAFKTIKYWEEKNNEKVRQVVITGEIAEKYYGLANAINKAAEIPVLMANKKKFTDLNLTNEARSIQLRYMITIGSFYRFVSGLEGVNLLPKAKKDEVLKQLSLKKLHKSSLYLSFANFSLVLLFLLTYVLLNIWNRSLLKVESIKDVQVRNHPAQNIIPEVKRTNAQAQVIDSLMRSQKDTGIRLDTISRTTPKSVTLTAIDFGQIDNEKWKISGVGSRTDILAYYDKLKETDAKEVSMPYSNFSKEKDNDFDINIVW